MGTRPHSTRSEHLVILLNPPESPISSPSTTSSMSSLFGARPTLSADDARHKAAQIKQEVEQQLALANAQELINKMNEKCFNACITKPSASLTPNDEACLMPCTDRFLEAFNLISAKYVQRVQRERDASSGASLLPQ